MRSIAYSFLLVFMLSACTPAVPQKTSINTVTPSVRIAATIFPLASFAQHVGGAHVAVSQTIPSGAEPHDYEPTAKHIAAIADADLFIMNGFGIDPWATDIRTERERDGKRTVSAAEVIFGQGGMNGGIADKDVVNDPHLWLSPKNAKKIAEALFAQLIAIDPPHATDYTKSLLGFTLSIAELDEAYRTGLSQCAKNTVIVSHDAYRLLAAEYGFKTVSIAGFSTEEEPSARRLREISDLAREQRIGYILSEAGAGTDRVRALASDLGASLLPLHPVEWLTQEEVASGKTYFSIMRDNLASFRTALECR